MAELQTISAAFDVARLALEACKFLKKVKDADKVAREAYDRSVRLRQVLDGVRGVLEVREEKGVVPQSGTDLQTETRIYRCIRASGAILKQVDKQIGGFNSKTSGGAAIVDKVKIALRQPGIVKLQNDLEARISALNTELALLQLYDHAHTHATIGLNHEELLETLAQLGKQVSNGNELLNHVIFEQRKLSTRSVDPQLLQGTTIDHVGHDDDSGAIGDLVECLHIAEDARERYTSEYAPDDRSVRFKRDVESVPDNDSPSAIATPVSEPAVPLLSDPARVKSSFSQISLQEEYGRDEDEDEDEEVLPLEILNMYIAAYRERAGRESESGHPNQAEVNMQSAIRYSEMRERHYDVAFVDRVHLQEEVALLYQEQKKYGEAVSKVHQLLRENGDEFASSRQHQILAGIYYDRHQNRSGPGLSNTTNDIENAERYAKKAFNKRFALLKQIESPSEEEVQRQNSCTTLLIRILETRDKTVEANELTKLLFTDGSSTTSDSLRRISTARQPNDFVFVNKQELFINAVKCGDVEGVQSLSSDSDVDVEKMDGQGKTALMNAVETHDETMVHKLLDPVVGSDVNTANKRGLTALHVAAAAGLPDMIRCLLHHDAEVDARDKRGETALIKAVQNDQSTIVQILCDVGGADLEVKAAEEWSALHYAVRLSKTNMACQLLDLAPELKDAVDQAGKTALMHCAEIGFYNQAAALLDHQNCLDVNAVDSVSRSALYFAATKPPTPKREDLVRLLVEKGAQVDDARPPPRYRDYTALKQFQTPRRESGLTRHDSVSTTGSIGTTSTGVTKLSRIFSGRMHMR